MFTRHLKLTQKSQSSKPESVIHWYHPLTFSSSAVVGDMAWSHDDKSKCSHWRGNGPHVPQIYRPRSRTKPFSGSGRKSPPRWKQAIVQVISFMFAHGPPLSTGLHCMISLWMGEQTQRHKRAVAANASNLSSHFIALSMHICCSWTSPGEDPMQ